MKKSDLSIRNICIAAIKRNTIPPFDFKFSKFHSNEAPFENQKILTILKLVDEEVVICSVIVSKTQWSILTTKRIITWDQDEFFQQFLIDFQERILKESKNDFKAKYTKGFFKFKNKQIMPVFIEKGRASIVMIYGIDTLVKITKE